MPPLPLPQFSIPGFIRFQELDGKVVAFNPLSGKYFVLLDQAEELWTRILGGDTVDLSFAANQELISHLCLHGLLITEEIQDEEPSDIPPPDLGFVELTEFNKLILEYPEIDRSLLERTRLRQSYRASTATLD